MPYAPTSRAVFAEHEEALKGAGINANDGLAALLSGLDQLPDAERSAVQAAIEAAYESGPALAMVDSDRGHHQPARSQRRDHRRLDSGRDSHLGPDVEFRG